MIEAARQAEIDEARRKAEMERLALEKEKRRIERRRKREEAKRQAEEARKRAEEAEKEAERLRRQPVYSSYYSGSEYRIAIYGQGGVGKSCFTIRFIRNFFVGEYDSSISDR